MKHLMGEFEKLFWKHTKQFIFMEFRETGIRSNRLEVCAFSFKNNLP